MLSVATALTDIPCFVPKHHASTSVFFQHYENHDWDISKTVYTVLCPNSACFYPQDDELSRKLTELDAQPKEHTKWKLLCYCPWMLLHRINPFA